MSSNVSESDSLDRLVLFKGSAVQGEIFFNVYLALAVLSDLLKTRHGQHRTIYGRDVSCVS